MYEDERIARARENRRKAAELLSLSGDIQRELDAALDKLDSARRWGVWDLLGGGLISGLVKHSRLDDAMSRVDAAKPMLRRLSRELGEIQLEAGMPTRLGGFAVFADFFFDGLFADLYMQDKIRQFRDDVRRTLAELRRVDDALRRLDQYEERILKGARPPLE